MEKLLPPIPAKRYFTIGEVSDLCCLKPHVLRYWEQEFTQLRPMKRRGNRRYYQHHEVLMIRKIRDLLYDQGFTVSGARNKLLEIAALQGSKRRHVKVVPDNVEAINGVDADSSDANSSGYDDEFANFQDIGALAASFDLAKDSLTQQRLQLVRRELFEIRDLLSLSYQKGY